MIRKEGSRLFQNKQTQNNNHNQLTDQQILNDMLMTEKHVSQTYDISVLETSKPHIRQTLQQIQQEEQHHAEEIYKAMEQRGWYGGSN